MSDGFELDPDIVEVIGTWLADVESEDDETADLDDLLGQLDELGLEDVLPEFRNALALAPRGSIWWLLIPVEEWTWDEPAADGSVVVIDEFGGVEAAPWAEVRARSRFLLEPGVALYTYDSLEAEDLPFYFDGDAWIGTRIDHAFGDSEWVVRVNGDELSFDLSEMEVVFAEPKHAPAGRWLSVETAGESMTTGEIGVTVYVTKSGGFFRHVWGCSDELLGHAEPDLDVLAVLSELDPEELGFSEVCSIGSDTLDVEAMRTAVAWVLEADINALEPSDVEVRCVNWSGTAEELLA